MCRFSCLLHLIILFVINNHFIPIFSILTYLQDNCLLVTKATPTNFSKRVPKCKAFYDNVAFTANLILYFSVSLFATWPIILLFISGDVHPHPGPLSTTPSNSISSSSSSLSSTVFSSINLSHHLSFVHYSVQSIASKLDILHTEQLEFDIIAFTETWLSASVATDDLVLDSYSKPERKDRVGDAHGGVMIYVKEYIHYRPDAISNQGEWNVYELKLQTTQNMPYLVFTTDHQTPIIPSIHPHYWTSYLSVIKNI